MTTARKPDFFIAGAPKCGTTSMYYYLDQHPEVFFPEGLKEPQYFSSDMWEPTCVTTEREYLALYAAAPSDKVAGDASVTYLASTVAPDAIAKFVPSAKIIIMLRNPVDVMYSAHAMNVQTGKEPLEDFAAALEAEADRREGRSVPRKVAPLTLCYRYFVRFAPQIRRYFDRFGRENVHIIVFDDLKIAPLEEYRKTCAFLSISPDFCPDLRRQNASRVVRRKRLLRGIVRLRSHVHPSAKRLARLALTPRGYRRVVQAINNLATREQPRPKVDPGFRIRLTAELAPDVAELGELIGRDLTHWSALR